MCIFFFMLSSLFIVSVNFTYWIKNLIYHINFLFCYYRRITFLSEILCGLLLYYVHEVTKTIVFKQYFFFMSVILFSLNIEYTQYTNIVVWYMVTNKPVYVSK